MSKNKIFNAFILFLIAVSLFILSSTSALAISTDFAVGLQKLASGMLGAQLDGGGDLNNDCYKPLFDIARAGIDYAVDEDAAGALFDALMTPIMIFIGANPVIGGILDAWDVYDALVSGDTWEKFKDILTKKALGKLAGKLGKKVEELTEADLDGIDSAVEGAKDLWDKNKGRTFPKGSSTESFQYGPFGNCDTVLYGTWFKRHNGDVIITANGDCKCKKFDTGKFALIIKGRISYILNPSGQAVTYGSYIDTKFNAECPCSKNTAYLINQDDGYYTYLTTHIDDINKGGDKIPSSIMTALKGHDLIAFEVNKGDKKNNILVALNTADNKLKINSISRVSENVAGKTPTLTIKADEYVINNILLSENKLVALWNDFNAGKFKVKSTKPTTNAAVAIANVASRVYSGFNSGQYEIAQDQQRAVTYFGQPATLTKTPTNVRVVTTQNQQYSTVVNRYGSPQGYVTPNTNALLSYNSNRYSQNAGVYRVPPTTIQNYYAGNNYRAAASNYGYSGVFVIGGGAASGGRAYYKVG